MSGLQIPDEAWTAAALQQGDGWCQRTVTEAVRAAAPLIAAAELRRWADLLAFKTGLIPDREVVSTAIEQLRARATELEGGPR